MVIAWLAAVVVVLTAVVTLYASVIRSWMRYWGATKVDIARGMPGDNEVPDPTYDATLAVTVNAAPTDIWPWLVQMGYRRGGLYSYDRLDRLFGFLDGPSATRVLPQFQQLRAGDLIPMGAGAGFPVRAVEPHSTLVLGGTEPGVQWLWEFGLYPIGRDRTRLVSRSRAHLLRSFRWWLVRLSLEPAAFIMTRKMLLGIKWRAESLARARQSSCADEGTASTGLVA
jgi:hypothetical protein